ncbi:MAG: hypothetical protein ACM3MG_12840, partial [Bacillota bacterium]
RLEGFIQKPAPGLIKAQVDVLNLMVTLTWSSASEYDNAISRLVLEPFYNNPLVSTEIKDQICSMNLTVVAIDPRRVKDKNWSNPDFYLALECMKPINADLMAVIVSKMPEMIKRDALPAGILAILGNAKYQTPQTIEVLSSLLFLRNPPLWDLYSYARETGTESPYFKKQLLKAFEQGQGADVYRILLYVHRNDHAFIDPVIENALKASSFAERLDNEYLLADVIETPLVFEKVLAAVNSMNPLQQETALRLIQGKSNLVRNKMLPTLTQIVKGNYPLVSRMLSLSIIIEETKGLANWNQYLKDIYLSGVPYQLRQLAFKNYDGDKKMSPSDIKLSPSKIDNSVPLFKFDDATDVGNSSVQTVVLGISQDAVPSDASKEDLLRYGFQLHRRTIDKRTNMVIGFEPINE